MRLRPFLLSAGLLLVSSSALSAASITGEWLTYKSKAMVQITQCGDGLCGKIVWLRQNKDSKGQPIRDIRNPDARLRGRAVLGLKTFSGLKPTGPNSWSGLIYNPNDGRTYRASIMLEDRTSVLIKGCRVGGSACGERTWMRVQKSAAN